MKDKEVEELKRALLENETALSQVEAAAIIGCRPRDLHEDMQPSYYRNGRPKYIAREVIQVRDRKVEAAKDLRARNKTILRGVTV